MYNILIPLVLYFFLLISNKLKSDTRFIVANISVFILIIIFYIQMTFYEVTIRFDNLQNVYVEDLSDVNFITKSAITFYKNLVYHFFGFLLINLINIFLLYLRLNRKRHDVCD